MNLPPSPGSGSPLPRRLRNGVAIAPDSKTVTSIGKRSSSVSSNSAASVVSGGWHGHDRLGQRRRGHLAQTLDVQRAAAADVLDATAELRRAAARIRAAQVGVALLRRGQRRAAHGAVGRHHELALGAVAQLDDRTEDLGDDVARLAQHDGVADQHALRLHHVLIVERRLAHYRTRRREPAPSPRTGWHGPCVRC